MKEEKKKEKNRLALDASDGKCYKETHDWSVDGEWMMDTSGNRRRCVFETQTLGPCSDLIDYRETANKNGIVFRGCFFYWQHLRIKIHKRTVHRWMGPLVLEPMRGALPIAWLANQGPYSAVLRSEWLRSFVRVSRFVTHEPEHGMNIKLFVLNAYVSSLSLSLPFHTNVGLDGRNWSTKMNRFRRWIYFFLMGRYRDGIRNPVPPRR